MGTATNSILAAAGVSAAYGVYSTISGLRSNIRAAKRSGFRYVVAPASPSNVFSHALYWLWSPVVRCLPKTWWQDWIVFLTPDWSYTQNHPALPHPLLIATPSSLTLLTANAELARQIAHRRADFPKDVEEYAILQQFGDNVLATEGDAWRAHRRAVGGAFGGRDGLVFGVAAAQAGGMVEKWMAEQESTSGDGEGSIGGGSTPVRTIDRDTMRLALNIIASVGFGLQLLWPGQSLPEGTDPRLHKYTTLEPAAGHTMSFVDAVAGMLDTLLLLLIVPEWLLRRLPFQRARFAAESRRNYETYMHELLSEKLEQHVRGEEPPPGMDVMGHLVRSSHSSPSHSPNEEISDSKPEAPGRLTTSDIIGNAFIVLVAGHETTANALHFTLLDLAANPAAQRALQRDLDRILGTADPATWRYEDRIGPLLGGMLGACMCETLRKVPSVVEIPKRVQGTQVVTIDGESRVLPPGAKVNLVAVAAHRDPRYWPTRRSRISGKEHDLDDYVPERWFKTRPGYEDDVRGPDTPDSLASQGSVFTRVDDAETPGSSVAGEEDGEGGSLFRPEKGAYLAFSDGPRSCLGKRIAQVEIAAVLAVIFQRYSIELAADDFVGDDAEEVLVAMDRAGRERVYRQAQERCRERIEGARSMLTLRMQEGEDVPVRLVRRGKEKFVSWMD